MWPLWPSTDFYIVLHFKYLQYKQPYVAGKQSSEQHSSSSFPGKLERGHVSSTGQGVRGEQQAVPPSDQCDRTAGQQRESHKFTPRNTLCGPDTSAFQMFFSTWPKFGTLGFLLINKRHTLYSKYLAYCIQTLRDILKCKEGTLKVSRHVQRAACWKHRAHNNVLSMVSKPM